MSIERVRDYFRPLGREGDILEFPVSSATVELAAQAVGVIPARIAKTLSFLVNDGCVLIVAAGDAKIDNSKYKHFFHTKAKMLTQEQAREMTQKLRKAEFDYNDFLSQMQQIKKMGGMGSILSMMPGVGSQLAGVDMDEGERSMHRVESIILSMTKEERANPGLMNPSRKQRIAKGAGVDIGEVNRLVKQFDQMKKMMKQMPGLMGGGKRKGMKGLGGLGGLMGGKMKLPF